MEKLHPGAKWAFRFGGYAFGFFIAIFLGWFIGPLVALIFKVGDGTPEGAITAVIVGIVVFIIIVLIFGEIYARMSYDRWFYEFTKDGLKLERGIIWKRYSNVPYERIQNVDINRGIIARMTGFSTVDIQTAGFSYGRRGGGGAEGHIPAVSPQKAEEIREFVMKRVSGKKGQGL